MDFSLHGFLVISAVTNVNWILSGGFICITISILFTHTFVESGFSLVLLLDPENQNCELKAAVRGVQILLTKLPVHLMLVL